MMRGGGHLVLSAICAVQMASAQIMFPFQSPHVMAVSEPAQAIDATPAQSKWMKERENAFLEANQELLKAQVMRHPVFVAREYTFIDKYYHCVNPNPDYWLPIEDPVTVDPLCPNHLQQALVQNREGLAELVTHNEIPNFYANDVILDPCVGNAHDCCMSTYGSGEYPTGSVSQTGYPEVKDRRNTLILKANSRYPDEHTSVDPECRQRTELDPTTLTQVDVIERVTEVIQDVEGNSITTTVPDTETCKGYLGGRIDDPYRPPCWDNNATVYAERDCFDPLTGERHPLCVQIAYMSSNFIVQCAGQYEFHEHCGTFLEIHLPGDDAKLSSARIPGGFTTGFRTIVLPTLYKGDAGRVLCEGSYEVWWVQRTRYAFIVEEKKKFQVVSPKCTFDPHNDRYLPYRDQLEECETSPARVDLTYIRRAMTFAAEESAPDGTPYMFAARARQYNTLGEIVTKGYEDKYEEDGKYNALMYTPGDFIMVYGKSNDEIWQGVYNWDKPWMLQKGNLHSADVEVCDPDTLLYDDDGPDLRGCLWDQFSSTTDLDQECAQRNRCDSQKPGWDRDLETIPEKWFLDSGCSRNIGG